MTEPGVLHAAKGACYFSLEQRARGQAQSQGLTNSTQEQKPWAALCLAAGGRKEGCGSDDLDWELGRSCLH